MKTFLSILFLILAAAGLISVILGVFFMKNQYLIVSGCLLVAIGTGLGYAARGKDHSR